MKTIQSSTQKLPRSDWRFVRLGDIAKTTSGGTPRRDRPQFYGGGIPWVKSGELGDRVVYETEETITEEALESSNAKVFPKGTLCIALYGATVGKLGILGIDAATNQAVCAIFPPDELDTQYLYRFFESKRRELVEQGKGGAQANISQGIIRDTEIPFPPLDEQERIVAEIEKQFTRLEAGMGALRRVQASLKRYRAAVLKAACEGRLVPTEAELARIENRKAKFEIGEALLARILAERRQNWNGRSKYKEPTAPDITNLPAISKGWTWATLDQLCPLFADSAHRTPKYGNAGFPALGPRDVVGGRLNLAKARLVDESEFAIQTARHVPQAGDIVYSRELSLGWGALVPEGRRLCMSQGMCLFRPHAAVNLRYFLALLNGPVGRKHAENSAIGSAHPHINLGDIKAYAFPLPPPVEQARIVAELERRLSVVEELETVVSTNLTRAIHLRQTVLREAFTGALT